MKLIIFSYLTLVLSLNTAFSETPGFKMLNLGTQFIEEYTLVKAYIDGFQKSGAPLSVE